MNVGYSQAVITPALDKSVYLAGFANNRPATTIHDDLYVRSLTIQDEQTTLVLVSLDLIGFIRPDVLDVIERIESLHPDAKIVIASTHTHHGPDTIGLWGPDLKTCGVDATWLSVTKDRIVDTILESISELKPASVKYTSVHVPGLVKNTRNPGIIDDELTLAQFTDATDTSKVTVTLMNFPCHPEALWEKNTHITADYPGYLCAEVERQTGSPCMFFAGALGGMLTPDVKDHSFEEAEFMGRKLAENGLKSLHIANGRSIKVSIQKREIKAELTNPLYIAAFDGKLMPDIRDEKGCIHTEVNLIKIGELWLATVPGELLPKLGLQLKAWMIDSGAQVAGVIGLANDELGYILPEEDFEFPENPFEPGKHYEETNSISNEIGPKVMDGVKSLLK
jgi:hypothetical protein